MISVHSLKMIRYLEDVEIIVVPLVVLGRIPRRSGTWHCVTGGVIDLTLPALPEEEYPLPVRSICLNLFRKTLYRLPPLFAEDGRGLRTANISKWQPQKNTALTCNDYVVILLET